ncbi:hypothetical protein ALC57_02543, partial [Trachymyrmex cornetzi]
IKERFDNKRWIVQRHIQAIFDVPALHKENHAALRELLNTILKHLRVLKALKRPTESWDDLIIHIIISKLDVSTNKAWETSILDANIPNLKMLMGFLSKRSQALESIQSRALNNQTSNTIHKQTGKLKNTSVTNIPTSNLSCACCKANHQVYHCEEFLNIVVLNLQATKRKEKD